MEWTYFILGLISWQVFRMCYLILDVHLRERRQKRFLKVMNVTFPDKKNLVLTSIDTSDKKALADLERQLRERLDSPEYS